MLSKTKIKVKVSKVFSYPRSVLERGNERNYAIGLALSDYKKELQELKQNRKEVDSEFFSFDASIEDGFVFRKPLKAKTESDVIPGFSFNDTLAFLTKRAFIKRYGIIDVDQNPNIFEDIEIDGNLCTVMKEDVEDYYSETHNYYYSVLEELIHDNGGKW